MGEWKIGGRGMENGDFRLMIFEWEKASRGGFGGSPFSVLCFLYFLLLNHFPLSDQGSPGIFRETQ
jgi:hypothetical protein